MIERNCKNCTSRFLVHLYQVKMGYGLYCSSKCSALGRWKNPTTKMIEHIKYAQKIAWKKRIGMKHSDESKKKISNNRIGKALGKNNHRYKGGYIDKNGYLRICVNGKQIFAHRHYMEQKIGRKLTRDEAIHHIDLDKLNNNISNLLLISNSEHIKLHFKIDPYEWRKRYKRQKKEGVHTHNVL